MRTRLYFQLCCILLSVQTGFVSAASHPPNFLIILADDLGYSDIGVYGSEIRTPVLDDLARQGIQFTDFYTAPVCSPSRAMLLTGQDHHGIGLGNMAVWLAPNQRGQAGYEGHLSTTVLTLQEKLSLHQYHTYFSGKWHLGGKQSQWPSARGFEKSFALLGGAGSHFSDRLSLLDKRPVVPMTMNGQRVDDLPPAYYSSKNFTDFMIESIDANIKDGKPFFAYLALQAPHTPLAVPDDWLNRYKGKYDTGYQSIQASRIARQGSLGILTNEKGQFTPLTSWESLDKEQQLYQARVMEIYAAMVSNLDHHIGRLFQFLKQKNLYDNTYIFFLSDNGAEGGDPGQFVRAVFGQQSSDWFNSTFDNQLANLGRSRSWVGTGPDWAQVSMTPFRLHKAFTAEGGIRAPLLVAGPGIGDHRLDQTILHIADITPSILALAGINDQATASNWSGRSFAALLTTPDRFEVNHRPLAFEMFGQRALRSGPWKLLSIDSTKPWQLYNLHLDPAELDNVAQSHQVRLSKMIKEWHHYAQSTGVIMPTGRVQPPLN